MIFLNLTNIFFPMVNQCLGVHQHLGVTPNKIRLPQYSHAKIYPTFISLFCKKKRCYIVCKHLFPAQNTQLQTFFFVEFQLNGILAQFDNLIKNTLALLFFDIYQLTSVFTIIVVFTFNSKDIKMSLIFFRGDNGFVAKERKQFISVEINFLPKVF